jgi:hypothetical protein
MLVGEAEGCKPFGQPRHRKQDNIKMGGIEGIGYEVVD